MTHKAALKFAHSTVATLLEHTAGSDPQEFKALLMGGIVANLVGNLPEVFWKEFIKAEPCGRPNCDCHLLAARHAPLLQAMRDDYLKHRPGNN